MCGCENIRSRISTLETVLLCAAVKSSSGIVADASIGAISASYSLSALSVLPVFKADRAYFSLHRHGCDRSKEKIIAAIIWARSLATLCLYDASCAVIVKDSATRSRNCSRIGMFAK